MKEVLIKQYEILISAPSDVFSFVDAVKEAINKYNNEQGAIDNIRFIHKNWKEHTVPAYGKSAQSIINEQLTNQAEIVIALFGAKFGEPTEKYASGTLEEIETVHQNGGLVCTFFGKGRIVDISNVTPEQLKKVQEYKASYNGLYKEFSSKKGLTSQVVEALKRIAQELKKQNTNDLKIYSVTDGELSDALVYDTYDFLDSPYMQKRREEIISLIQNINSIVLEKPQPKENPSGENAVQLSSEELVKITKTLKTIAAFTNTFPTKKVEFKSDFLENIKTFARTYNIEISEDFLYVRNGGYTDMGIMGWTLSGDDDEQKKIKLLLNLEEKLLENDYLVAFLSQYVEKYYLTLAIKNESNIFADDITIKLFLDKDSFVNPLSLTINEKGIGRYVQDFPDIFEQKNNVEIDNMYYGQSILPTFISYPNPLGGETRNPDLEYYKEYYKAKTEQLYPFVVNEKSDQIVIKIELPHGVKQFSAQFLSAAIMLKKPIESIKYTITSKSFGHEIKGELKKSNDNKSN